MCDYIFRILIERTVYTMFKKRVFTDFEIQLSIKRSV